MTAEKRNGLLPPPPPTVVGSWCRTHRRVVDLKAETCPDYRQVEMDSDGWGSLDWRKCILSPVVVA